MKRNYNQNIVWEGNLNDDCLAKWSGLLLRTEWMDEDYWWWCVYDMLDNENQIDSSNEYNERFIDGEIAREKAEEVAKEYLTNEIITEFKSAQKNLDTEKLLLSLKRIGVSPVQSTMILIKEFDFEYSDSKNKVFASKAWSGLREQSEYLTQQFLEAGLQIADKVEYTEDGQVSSITMDISNDKLKKKRTLWSKLKQKFKI